ncbi:conserved exported hypothetical protein [Candidatus Sulfopaludibacter sp. SbA3]|nr:conserved exported hypothetical protein [Candidatus Sulfopaludibacter sp. SbA3]
MKKLLAVFALVASCGLAADWTGYIVDKSCAGKKAMWGNEACAQSCIKRGDPAVFVTADGKIYQITEQAKVTSVAGKKVTITGKMDGDKISVESVKVAD